MGKAFFAQPEATRVASLYRELLGRLPELIDHTERYEHLWKEEEGILDATEQALRSKLIQDVGAGARVGAHSRPERIRLLL